MRNLKFDHLVRLEETCVGKQHGSKIIQIYELTQGSSNGRSCPTVESKLDALVEATDKVEVRFKEEEEIAIEN